MKMIEITEAQYREYMELLNTHKIKSDTGRRMIDEVNRKQFAGKTQEEISEMMRERAKKAHEARRQNKLAKQSDK